MHETLILSLNINTILHGNIDEYKEYFCESEYDEIYRGWKIVLDIPNGGILGFCLLNEAYDVWMGEYTEGDFDYHDKDGIINYAKSVIDKIEETIATCGGQQLALFEVA